MHSGRIAATWPPGRCIHSTNKRRGAVVARLHRPLAAWCACTNVYTGWCVLETITDGSMVARNRFAFGTHACIADWTVVARSFTVGQRSTHCAYSYWPGLPMLTWPAGRHRLSKHKRCLRDMCPCPCDDSGYLSMSHSASLSTVGSGFCYQW